MFMFERSREPCATCLRSSGVENPVLLVYVRAESRTLFMFELSWHLVYVRAESRTLRYLFMFERSREPCATCLRSSGVENPTLLDTLFMFERSRELFATWHLVYVRTFITPCLRSSGVENPFRQAGGVENPTLLYSLFMFEPYWHHVYVRAESRTPFRIVTLRTTSYLNNECHFYILKVLLIYPSSDRLRLAFLLCSIFWFFSQNKRLDQRRWMFQKTWVLKGAY